MSVKEQLWRDRDRLLKEARSELRVLRLALRKGDIKESGFVAMAARYNVRIENLEQETKESLYSHYQYL